MTEGLVCLEERLGFARFDTKINTILALHSRLHKSGEHVGVEACAFNLCVEPPDSDEDYENFFSVAPNESEKLCAHFHIPPTDFNLNNIKMLKGKLVRVYYLGKKIIGYEPLDQVIYPNLIILKNLKKLKKIRSSTLNFSILRSSN